MPPDPHQNMSWKARIMEGVEIVDKSYLDWKCHPLAWDNTIDTIMSNFTLNKEQEQAFHIVANHVCHPKPDQLKMYIGGMAGTGKSQVLKALMKLFELQSESYCFIVMAPTGNAATLLGGTTYHSMFGVNDWGDQGGDGTEQLDKRRAWLVSTDYLFVDECSMLSCHDMFCLSLIEGNYGSGGLPYLE